MKPSAWPRRFAHLWFPRLAIDRVLRRTPPADGRPLAMVETLKGALRLTAVDEAAEGEGLAVGMTLADARAQAPRLRVLPADPVADLGLLARLAEACRRYTPALALRAPDGIDLDVTGCTALFGGEAALLSAVQAQFEAQLSLRVALADTSGLAWAMARHGQGGVVAAGAGEAMLAVLPVAALGLAPEAVRVLAELGLKRVGQLMDLPRAALARRLGEDALHRLDVALGRRADPLETRLEVEPLRAERRVFEPLADEAQVLQVAGDLARELAELLARRGLGGRRFALELFRADGAVKRLEIAASRPLADPQRIVELFAERLAGLNEGLEADFGFDQFRLSAGGADALAVQPLALLERSDKGRGLAELADRLAARTGVRLVRPAPGDAHLPERAVAARPLCAPSPDCPSPDWRAEVRAAFEGEPLRPMRLFDPPQPVAAVMFEAPEGAPARFTWRRVTRTVVRAEGPERLEPEWVQARPGARVRDYYRLEDEAGRRYWLFREGRYDAPDIPPPGAVPPEARPEAIRPVRSPPDAEATMAAAPQLATRPPLAPVPRGQGSASASLVVLAPTSRGRQGPPDESDAKGEDASADAEPPPAPPRWFLHGLFG